MATQKVPKVAIGIESLAESPFIGVLLHDFVGKSREIVTVDPDDFCGQAVVLNGEAAQDIERLSALVELLTTTISKRVGRPIKVYQQGRQGGWKRITRLELD